MASISAARDEQDAVHDYKIWQVIAASSAGTMIEWYDFYIFGSLAAIISALFFPPDHPTAAFLATLATFATGFLVRPFGAIVFGRLGDLVGRKYTFLLTLLIMGGATTVIGLLPTYSTIGVWAPIILVSLRLLQGLALGGEYGGAATYVSEHSPDHRRGFYTSWIQTTATVGLFVSLGIILATRLSLGDEAFKAWGWRIPFLLSVLLVGMSYYIRIRLKESPLFTRLKSVGRQSKNPLKDSFGNKKNWGLMMLALFGAVAGQATVWYTGQFYALFFLQTVLKVNFVTANIVIAIALALGTPFFVVFASLSDRIGRKKIMMLGCLLFVLTVFPIFRTIHDAAGPTTEIKPAVEAVVDATGKVVTPAVPAVLEATEPNTTVLVIMVFILMIYVTMAYGPIAAYLVELFPTAIRYTSMSLPYHIGNGWFGGLTPLIASSVVVWAQAQPDGFIKDNAIYMGLVYPAAIALMTFIVGSLKLKETSNVKLWDEMEHLRAEGKAA